MTVEGDADMPGQGEYKRIKMQLYEQIEPIKEKGTMDILKFIKDFQEKNPKEELTKEEIARFMDSSGKLSRPVTLRIIKKLLDPKYKIILNEPKKPNSQSRIIINPEYDFKNLELDVLALLINEIREQFEPIEIETRGVNTALIRELQASIYDFREKEQIYTPKQMEKFKLDYQKKMAKQFTRGYDRALKGFKVPYESGIIRKAT